MNWINILVPLLSNPAIQEMIKQIEAQFAHKTATAGMAAMAATAGPPRQDHKAAMQQAVDEVVAKHVRTP